MVNRTGFVPVGGSVGPALVASKRADDRSASVSSRDGAVVGGEVDLEPFKLIGFSWSGGSDGQVRTRSEEGEWSDWSVLSSDMEHGHAESESLVSEPIWVGSADGYEVAFPPGTTGLQAHIVSDGPKRFTLSAGRSAEAQGTPPMIRTRSGWGARAPKEPNAVAGELKMAVVHHTGVVSHNDYEPADVPDLLRAVQAFHLDVRGWNDIGYNFLVDRFGRVWEGRDGGIDQAVVGSHALGSNIGSTGVVLIGETNQAAPTRLAIDGLAEFLGWKLFIHGVDPGTEAVVYPNGPGGNPMSIPRIVGHRDLGSTSCPGDHAYSQLATIRHGAAQQFTSLGGGVGFDSRPITAPSTAVPLIGDFDGDRREDVFWYAPGAGDHHLWYGQDDGAFSEQAVVVRSRYEPFVGDFDGDDATDIFWFAPGDQDAAISFGNSGRSPRFRTIDVTVTAPGTPLSGDFDGDGDTDIFWYRAGSAPDEIWWGGSGRSFVAEARSVWGDYTPFVGDFDGDGLADLYWYAAGPAADTIWFGSRSGEFVSRTQPVEGAYHPVIGDLDGDGTDDIVWHAAGETRTSVFAGSQDRNLRWSALDTPSGFTPRLGDFTGGGREELLWFDGLGHADIWRRTGEGQHERTTLDAPAGQPLILDVNGDGRDDVLWSTIGGSTHRLWLAN